MLYNIDCDYIIKSNKPVKFFSEMVDYFRVKMRFRLLDDDNNEHYLEAPGELADEDESPETDGLIDMIDGTKRLVSDFVPMYFENDSGYVLVPDVELMHHCSYNIGFTAVSFDQYSKNEPLEMPGESVRDFIKNHAEEFDIPENNPVRVENYRMHVIKTPFERLKYYVYVDKNNKKAICTNRRLTDENYLPYTQARSMDLAESYAQTLQLKLDEGQSLKKILQDIDETLKRPYRELD